MGNASKQLKKLRLYLKMTQEEFANAVSSKRNSIAMIESGKNKPTFDLISDICGAFNLTADYFLSDDNPEGFSENLSYSKYGENVTNSDTMIAGSKVRPVPGSSVFEDTVKQSLTLLANSSLLYLEFHLSDIRLNLKLLQESLTGHAFNRAEYEKAQKRIIIKIQELKSLLKSEQLTTESLLKGLVRFDESIRDYLDEIRELSKELYLNTPRQ
ncbi:MAG: helix-turn-helix transcriptional regulator [Bacteroidetes bacterium]|nr:helix-turn-helix transcriptional regulator [Bacteroidota bacterium]